MQRSHGWARIFIDEPYGHKNTLGRVNEQTQFSTDMPHSKRFHQSLQVGRLTKGFALVTGTDSFNYSLS
ncbi:unnamed protein product, partial [Dicrocoelium dendriticum]